MDDDLMYAVVVGVFFLLAVIIWAFQPMFEARAYERVTGKHVGYWDAVFLDLRVQESVK